MSEINISQYKCRGYLFSSYNLLEMSAIEIGKENKVSYNTIYNWLKKFNIQIRTPKEHQIITQNKPEIKAKKSKSNKGKNNPNYGKFGDKHHNWKGNNIGFGQIHLRAHRIDPKPEDEKCEICGKVADKKGITKLIHSNKDHSYKLPINPDDWQWIHENCHKKYDKKNNIKIQKRNFTCQ